MIPKIYVVAGWNCHALCDEVNRLERQGHKVHGMELAKGLKAYGYVESNIFKVIEADQAAVDTWLAMADAGGFEKPEKIEMPEIKPVAFEPAPIRETVRRSRKHVKTAVAIEDRAPDAETESE